MASEVAGPSVHLRLIQGDARDVPADLMVMGHRNPVRQWLDLRGCVFRPIDPGRGRAKAWECSPGDPWRRAVALKPQIGHVSRTRLCDDLSDVLGWALRSSCLSEVIMIPLSWRNPELVAFNMLLAL